MKIVLNPRTKNALRLAARARLPESNPDCGEMAGWPATSDTYAGTSGSTHGERKEMRPAAKAAARPTTEMSIRANSPCGARALSRRCENALYRRDQRLGRLR